MKKMLLGLTVFLLAVLAVAGCQSDKGKAGAKEAVSNLNQAKVINVGDQPAFFIFKIAQEKGLFEKEFGKDGIKINVVSYVKQGPAIVESIASKNVDIALLGTLPTITANANGNKIIALASGNYTDDGFALFVGPSTGIDKVEGLKGKKLGVTFGTNEHQVSIKILEKHQLAPADVQLTNLSAADALTALRNGDIEAALLKGNDFVAAQKFGAVAIANNSEVGPVANVLVGREAFIKENPELTARFLKVAQEAAKYVEANPEEAVQIAAKITGAPLENAKVNYASRKRLVTAEGKYLADPLQATLDFVKAQKLITKDVLVKDVVDVSYFKAAGLQ